MRNDTKANWILALSAVSFAAAFVWRLDHDGTGARAVYFLTQSAFIGSAADWFAVTALFRRPLGIPFHTALIPRHRKRLIRGIRRTVEERLVRPELWQELSAGLAVSCWLRGQRETLQGRHMEALMARAAGREARAFLARHGESLGRFAEDGLASIPAKAAEACRMALVGEEAAGRMLTRLLQGGAVLLTKAEVRQAVAAVLRQFTEAQKKNRLIAMVISAGESMGVISYDGMAAAICRAGREQLLRWNDPSHPYRAALQTELSGALQTFLASPAAADMIEETVQRVLGALPVEDAAEETAARLLSDWDREDERGLSAQKLFEAAARQALDRALADEALCRAFDEACRVLFRDAAVYEHAFLGDAVESVLDSYDEKKMNTFIYSKVRDELGWVRMNGAFFAAAAGLFLFSLASWLAF